MSRKMASFAILVVLALCLAAVTLAGATCGVVLLAARRLSADLADRAGFPVTR